MIQQLRDQILEKTYEEQRKNPDLVNIIFPVDFKLMNRFLLSETQALEKEMTEIFAGAFWEVNEKEKTFDFNIILKVH